MENKALNILWTSNSPLTFTGYGNQTRLFVPLIKQLGYNVFIQAFFGQDPYTAPIMWEGIEISGRGFDLYGRDVVNEIYTQRKADLLITLIDAWIFEPALMAKMRWIPWFPVDSDPVPPLVLERVRYAFDRIVYSQFAKKQMDDYGVPAHYVPHGTNTDIFKPITESERQKAHTYLGLPDDAFIVGIVAANKGYPSRKAFEQNLMAFKKLTEKHSDAVLFMQTMAGEGGNQCVDLPAFCRQIGLQLGKNVFFCNQAANVLGRFNDNYMVLLYNSLDVLLSVSRGEGFGIPILEAQSCGTPVITGDWTSMPEITFSGWKVDKKDAELDPTQLGSFQFLPHVDPIYERLEAAYQMRGNMDYRKRARDGALAYDVRKITEKYWKPTLEKIAARIELTEKLKAQVSVPVPQAAKPLDVKEVTV